MKTLFETLDSVNKNASKALIKPLQKLYFEEVFRPLTLASFDWLEAKSAQLVDVAHSNIEEKLMAKGVDPADAKLLAVVARTTALFLSKSVPHVIKASKEVLYAGEQYLDDTADE
jgi:hypothetical protein